MQVSVPPEYADIQEYLDSVLAELRKRYERATKLDAYMYRIMAARKVRDVLLGLPRPSLRIVNGGLSDDKPLISELSSWEVDNPRYNIVPRIPDINATFSRWENMVLYPIRFFARPGGTSPVDRAAYRINEAGVSAEGKLFPVKQTDESHYKFCDSRECFEAEFRYDENNHYVYFTFPKTVRINAIENTDEVKKECDFHSPPAYINTAARLASSWFITVPLAIVATQYRAAKAWLNDHEPNPVAAQWAREFFNTMILVTCKGLLKMKYDSFETNELIVCLGGPIYKIYVPTDYGYVEIAGIGGMQTYEKIEDIHIVPCSDVPLPGPPPMM